MPKTIPTSKSVGEIIKRLIANHQNKKDAHRFDQILILDVFNRIMDEQLTAKTEGFNEEKVTRLKLGALLWVMQDIQSTYTNATGLYRFAMNLKLVSNTGEPHYLLWMKISGSEVCKQITDALNELDEASLTDPLKFMYLEDFYRIIKVNLVKVNDLKFFTGENLLANVRKTTNKADSSQSAFTDAVNNSTPTADYIEREFKAAPQDYIDHYRRLRQEDSSITNDKLLNKIEQCLQILSVRIAKQFPNDDKNNRGSTSNLIRRGALLYFAHQIDPKHQSWESGNILFNRLLQALNLDSLEKIPGFETHECLTEFEACINRELKHLQTTKKLPNEWEALHEAEPFLKAIQQKINNIKKDLLTVPQHADWSFKEWFNKNKPYIKQLTASSIVNIAIGTLATWAFLGGSGGTGAAITFGFACLRYVCSSWLPGVVADPESRLIKKIAGVPDTSEVDKFLETAEKFPDTNVRAVPPIEWQITMLTSELISEERKLRLARVLDLHAVLATITREDQKEAVAKLIELKQSREAEAGLLVEYAGFYNDEKRLVRASASMELAVDSDDEGDDQDKSDNFVVLSEYALVPQKEYTKTNNYQGNLSSNHFSIKKLPQSSAHPLYGALAPRAATSPSDPAPTASVSAAPERKLTRI